MDNIVTRFLSRHPLYLIFLTIILTAFFSYISSSDNSITRSRTSSKNSAYVYVSSSIYLPIFSFMIPAMYTNGCTNLHQTLPIRLSLALPLVNM